MDDHFTFAVGWLASLCINYLFRKLNQAGYDCVYLEGPHELPRTSTVEVDGQVVEITNGERDNARAWFLYHPDDPADASPSQNRQPMTYIGLQESLDMVEDMLTELITQNKDEFVFIFGFSQGSVLCHILSRLAEALPDRFGAIRAAVLASGFAAQHVWPDQDATTSYTAAIGNLCDRAPISMPSLHTIGQKDQSVLPTMSEDLAQIYLDAVVYYHEKGHMIVQRSGDCAQVVQFRDAVVPVAAQHKSATE